MPFAKAAYQQLHPPKSDAAKMFNLFPDFEWQIDPELVFETYVHWRRTNFAWPPPPMRDVWSGVNRNEVNHLNAAHAVITWLENNNTTEQK